MPKYDKNAKFPDSFLDQNQNVRADLLDKDARDWARELGYKISTHQVRRFFDEVKRYKMQLKRNVPYSRLKPQIYMLKSKAKYAAHKKNEMGRFYTFIENSIEKIKEGKDDKEQQKRFEAFCLFFEAVYGFANFKKN